MNTKNVSGEFNAELLTVSDSSSLEVKTFVDFSASSTPGNVGICMSGGGSRAMTAGMGQLRGLLNLKDASGNSLLSLTKAISTVSGGSWLGVPFVYLNASVASDDDYLGNYVAPDNVTVKALGEIGPTNIGHQCNDSFSVLDLAWQAMGLYWKGVKADMLWQTLVAKHILKPYGLFADQKNQPDSLYSYNAASLAAITGSNPTLKDETAHLVADGASQVRRPYLVCNFAMFVDVSGEPLKYLVPVQATPFFTGVVSTPPGADITGDQQAGGGGVTPFAFSSGLQGVSDINVKISQSRQFTLLDSVGTSSAAFAEVLNNFGRKWLYEPETFFEMANSGIYQSLQRTEGERLSEMPDDVRNVLKRIDSGEIGHLISGLKGDVREALKGEELKLDDFMEAFSALKDIVPTYSYWPVVDAKSGSQEETRFADAGNLENTGVNALLTYKDIDNIISFVNSETAMTSADFGIVDKDGNTIPGTLIKIDSQIPFLFGYQPYEDGVGYKLYAGDSSPKDPVNKHNQVFASEQFEVLLKGLWANASGKGSAGASENGANYLQALETIENKWFGVPKGKKINVLWVYLNFINDWYTQLPKTVQDEVFDNNPRAFNGFPNYGTLSTQLTPTEVNVLASMTSWNVIQGAPELFKQMYSNATS
ncbi:hypothetical protein ACFL2V_13580 [Pseudomonadota bacterium]